jgi:hypothetical protein
MVATGDYEFLDETVWHRILTRLGKPGPHDSGPALDDLIFRLWVGRVLNYTTVHAARGFDHALDYLQRTIEQYEKSATLTQGDQR